MRKCGARQPKWRVAIRSVHRVLPVSRFLPLAPIPLFSCGRDDCEAHRTHQAHLVDLFSHVNFYFVSAGFPCALWRGEREIAAIVFERNVHRILSDHHRGIEAGYRFQGSNAQTPEIPDSAGGGGTR